MTRILFLIISVYLATASASAQDRSIVINEGLLKKVSEMSVPTRQSELSSWEAISDIENIGNFGKVVTAKIRSDFAPTNGNFISGRSIFSSTSSKGASQFISLCGLKVLLSSNAGNAQNSLIVIAPIGKLFIPFGMTYSSKQSVDYVANSLEFDSVDVCSPKRSSSFQLDIVGGRGYKLSGIFGSGLFALDNMQVTLDTLKCDVAATYSSAKSLGIPIEGDALLVACTVTETRDKNVRQSTSKYAYSKSLGVYLALELKGAVETETFRYLEIR